MKNHYLKVLTHVAPLVFTLLFSSLSFAQIKVYLDIVRERDAVSSDYYWSATEHMTNGNVTLDTNRDFNSSNTLIGATTADYDDCIRDNANSMIIKILDSALADITTISPDRTCEDSGDSIIITGTNFIGTTDLYFNGTPAIFTVVSDTQITAVVPNGATTGPLSLTTTDGTFIDEVSFYIVDNIAPVPDVAILTDIISECEVTTLIDQCEIDEKRMPTFLNLPFFTLSLKMTRQTPKK